MNVVSLRQESADQGHFYVPQFEIRIEGSGLPRDVLRDVTQLTYKDSIAELDSFEITVNNWDPTTRRFKYVGSETEQSLKGDGADTRRFRLFEPCRKKVEVKMGYAGAAGLRTMLRGTFTTMEPSFPSGGAPTLTVRGLNVLHQLRHKQYSDEFGDRSDSQIAKIIETRKDKGAPRFPYPIDIDENAQSKEPILPYVAQKNQYDIDFLWGRARQRGYIVVVIEGDKTKSGRQSKDRLYFGPSTAQTPGLRDVTFELKWGQTLIDFKPTLTTANQVKSVTVNGWNRKTRKGIHATVSLAEVSINKDTQGIFENCDAREERVVDEPVFTEAQAKDRARAILMDRFKEMVKCSATCVGLPDLRAGRSVKIDGLGARFSGIYFVTASTHTINDNGYITKFDARREDPGKGNVA